MSLIIILLIPLVLGAWMYLWRTWVAPRITVSMAVSSASLPYGRPTDLTVRMINPARLPAPHVACSFVLPDGLRLVPPGHPQEDDPKVRRCRVALALGPRQETEATFRVYGCRRGRQVVAQCSLVLGDGLTPREIAVTRETSVEVAVHPRMLTESRSIAVAERRFGTSSVRRKLYATSLDWINIRSYQPGDAFRDIAWPLTARRGELVVLERAPSIERRVVLLLNAQVRERHWAHEPAPVNRIYEEALAAALHLVGDCTHLTVHTNAVWHRRANDQRFAAIEFAGLARAQVAQQLGHWLGSLSTYAETGFVRVVDRAAELLAAQPCEVVVFTAYDDGPLQDAYARLRTGGHHVSVLAVGATNAPETVEAGEAP